MRAIIIFLVLISSTANAEFDTAWIITKAFSIYIEAQAGNGKGAVLVYVKEDASSQEEKRYPFNEECTFKGHIDWPTPDSFSCHNNGHTPLAGATYKLIKHGKSKNGCASENEPGHRYICIKGCKKQFVPQYLEAFDGMC